MSAASGLSASPPKKDTTTVIPTERSDEGSGFNLGFVIPTERSDEGSHCCLWYLSWAPIDSEHSLAIGPVTVIIFSVPTTR
jgi:hypothetical protein